MDQSKMDRTYSELVSKFKWFVCGNLVNDASTVKGCKHTFWDQCLKAHRAIIDECPVCQTPVQGVIRVPDICEIGKRIIYLMEMSKHSQKILNDLQTDVDNAKQMEQMIVESAGGVYNRAGPSTEEEKVGIC